MLLHNIAYNMHLVKSSFNIYAQNVYFHGNVDEIENSDNIVNVLKSVLLFMNDVSN